MLSTSNMQHLHRPRAFRARGGAAGPVSARSRQPRRRLAPASSIVCSASSAGWPARIASAVCQQPAFQLAAAVVVACQRIIGTVRDKAEEAFPQLHHVDKQALQQQLLGLRRNMQLMALVVLPLARASSESLTAVYARTFEKAAFGFAKMYLFCLFMRVLLSWFPGIDWNAQPWTFLRLITEPYLQIYRGILPPLFGQLDFTPLFGFLILQDVVEVMTPTYTMGLHAMDESTKWTTSDALCYFDGF